MASASSLASNTYTEVFTSRTASSLLLASFCSTMRSVAFAVADDAAVAGRIVEDGGEHGRAVAAFLVEGEQLVKRVGVEQRHVGCGDQHGAVQIVLLRELRHRALHGAAGSGDVVLVDDGDVLVVGACGFGDAFGLVVDHHGERIGVRAATESMTRFRNVLPAKVCSTFGLLERMRVPSPAARMIAALSAIFRLPFCWFSRETSIPDGLVEDASDFNATAIV